jgi:hemerythrin superfamily protein
MTSAEINTGQDVVAFLKSQHEEIKALFTQVADSSGEARQDAFVALRRLLAVHETAEEQVVHPRAERTIPDGKNVVGARLQEENEAKQTLARLEDLEPDSAEFETLFRELQADVIQHAEAEEQQEFAALAELLDPEQLERMRNAARVAQATAPTRPHPGVESATANTLVGPFAAMLDRARDLLSGKTG